MPARQASTKAPATKQSARKKAGSRGRAKKRSPPKTQIQKMAVKVLAGAAAGAVRALIPPLDEASGTSEDAAGHNKQGKHMGRRSIGKSGDKSDT
jgi:hypothetical protein